MNAPVTHIIPVTLIRRERLLHVPGRILVRKGQKVVATDPIAEANLHAEHALLDLARALGVSTRQVERVIQVQEGAIVEKGDLLAGPVGLPSRRVYSPCSGKIIMIDSGQALIEVSGQPFQLKAGLSGEIIDLVGDKGVVIETTGALIQGVWGNGKIEHGLMLVLAKTADHVLTPDQLDVSMRGAIVFAGNCDQPETLKVAEELPLRGLILASMSARLVKLAQKLHIPVILIDGFGNQAVNPVAYKLLSTNDRRDVILNAEAWNPLASSRPEIVIPLPGTGNQAPPRDSGVFAPEQQVRILRAPHAGSVGTLVRLRGMIVLPSGLRAQGADIKLGSGEIVLAPLVNLEIIA